MNNTNKLISSDNVGFAAILLEEEMDPGSLPGKSRFVGAFASANLGDSSPNTDGPKCEFTRKPCDLYTSTCPKKDGACFASGPGKDQFDSCKIIASKLFDGAKSIINSDSAREVTGKISFIHQFVNMSNATGRFLNTTTGSYEEVCVPLPTLLRNRNTDSLHFR